MGFFESPNLKLTVARNLSGSVLIEPNAAEKTIPSRDLSILTQKEKGLFLLLLAVDGRRNQESQQCVYNK